MEDVHAKLDAILEVLSGEKKAPKPPKMSLPLGKAKAMRPIGLSSKKPKTL